LLCALPNIPAHSQNAAVQIFLILRSFRFCISPALSVHLAAVRAVGPHPKLSPKQGGAAFGSENRKTRRGSSLQTRAAASRALPTHARACFRPWNVLFPCVPPGREEAKIAQGETLGKRSFVGFPPRRGGVKRDWIEEDSMARRLHSLRPYEALCYLCSIPRVPLRCTLGYSPWLPPGAVQFAFHVFLRRSSA
jgi:hypothetical protein